MVLLLFFMVFLSCQTILLAFIILDPKKASKTYQPTKKQFLVSLAGFAKPLLHTLCCLGSLDVMPSKRVQRAWVTARVL